MFTNREPAVVNNAYEDTRFCKEIDDMSGFNTRNLICTPLLFSDHQCLGTIQSMNKREGNFTNDDLELLKLAAGMVAIAINNSKRYNELLVANEARKNFINKITANMRNIFDK